MLIILIITYLVLIPLVVALAIYIIRRDKPVLHNETDPPTPYQNPRHRFLTNPGSQAKHTQRRNAL